MIELVKKLRELCLTCVWAPQNRNRDDGKLEPACDGCILKHRAADEIERLRLQLAAAEARAAYWEHDSDCCGGCSKCSRLAVEMEVAVEKARVI